MENMSTKERFTFSCNRWLAKDEDDGAIVREIPAEGPGIKTPLPCKFAIMWNNNNCERCHSGRH